MSDGRDDEEAEGMLVEDCRGDKEERDDGVGEAGRWKREWVG